MSAASAIKRRPVRTKCCASCRGTGQKEDGPWLHDNEGPIPGAPSGALCMFVGGSATIFEACREAQEIAFDNNRFVAFDFNQIVVTVGPADDPDKVARAWWQTSLHETPEETMARR